MLNTREGDALKGRVKAEDKTQVSVMGMLV